MDTERNSSESKGRTFSVSEKFVKEAHAAACASWKDRIEAEFPELYPSLLTKIKGLQEFKEFYDVFIMKERATIEIEGKYIYVPLPNANEEWTFKAWRLAEAICKNFKYYPHHGYETDKSRITLRKKTQA